MAQYPTVFCSIPDSIENTTSMPARVTQSTVRNPTGMAYRFLNQRTISHIKSAQTVPAAQPPMTSVGQ